MRIATSKALLAGLTGLALTFGAGSAWADTTYIIAAPNAALSALPSTGPYATAVVSLVDSTHATVTFDSLINDGFLYLMGDGSSVSVNVNATTWNLASITGSNSITGFDPGNPYTNGGSGNVSGFGVFNQTVDSFDGFGHSSTEIVLSLTNISGTWATSANVLTPNSSGNTVAIHAFACDNDPNACTINTGATATGFAGVVPIPAAAWLFGSGLIGLIGIARRKRAVQSGLQEATI